MSRTTGPSPARTRADGTIDPAPGRVLLTGARGFIGSHLVRRLVSDGHEVHAVSRYPVSRNTDVQWRRADLADVRATAEVVAEVAPDLVLHLASQASGDRAIGAVSTMLRDNLLSAVNVMSAVAGSVPGCRVVMAGSVEEPRSVAPGLGAHSPYAAAKAAATTYATLFRDLWDLRVTVLRLAMVYGPGDPNEHRLLPYAVRSLVDGERPRLSSGRRPIDWVYIDDVVDAFVAAATYPSAVGAVVDIGSGVATTIKDTVDRAADLVGAGVRPDFGAVPDRAEERAHVANIELARELLGWRPRVALDDGLRQTIASYRSPVRALAG